MSQTAPKRQSYVPNRSCERCRTLKIRCLSTDSATSNTCQRCVRLKLDCVYALPAKRRPRKRTDTKVAELEKEVRVLSSILRKQHESITSLSPTILSLPETWQALTPESDTASSSNLANPTAAASSSSTSSPAAALSRHHDDQNVNSPIDLDIIGSGLLSYHEASKLFDFFVNNVAPRFPVVRFTEETTAGDLQMNRPMLFLAILATASVGINPELSRKLHEKLTLVIAQQSMIAYARSLDLLQALLVATVWYFPEQSFDQLKYQQYSHMIALIGTQIGLDKKSKERARQLGLDADDKVSSFSIQQPEQYKELKGDELERKRTLISCYLLCSGICRSMHRPPIFPYGRWMNECFDQMESSPLDASTDKHLSLWTRMQRIMTESAAALGVDDPGANIDLSEPRVQHIIQSYDAQLDSWYSRFTQSIEDDLMRLVFHVNKVYLHEIALYTDHDPDDFKPPFTIDRIAKSVDAKSQWTAVHIQSLAMCWSHACEGLDIFLSFSVDYLRTCPDITFIRLVYCVVVMVKLSVSVGNRNCPLPCSMPFADESQYERIISYIERLVNHMQATAQGGLCPIAARFGKSLLQIKYWCVRQRRMNGVTNAEDNLLEPLQDLSLDDKPDEIEVSGYQKAFDVNSAIASDRPSSSQENSKPGQQPEIGDPSQFLDPQLFQDLPLDWDSDPMGSFDPTFGFDMDPVPDFGFDQGRQFETSRDDFDVNDFQWDDDNELALKHS